MVLGFIGRQTCLWHPARRQSWPWARPSPRTRRPDSRLSGDDGGLIAARDDQAVRGEGFQGAPDHAGTDALQPAGLGD
jgi:hypothetical protein